MSSKITFYFNYNGLRQEWRHAADKQECVKNIVNSCYHQNLGKIVNVSEMQSERGCFFIITFNKETWNMDDSVAKELYTNGFPLDTWDEKPVFLKDYPIQITNKSGQNWQVYLTSMPYFNIDDKKEHFDILGEWTYDIMWNTHEQGLETELFEVDKKKIDVSEYTEKDTEKEIDVQNEVIEYPDSHKNESDQWGGDNSWDEEQFYEEWATELDEQGQFNSGSYSYASACNTVWEPKEYRYDLTYIVCEPSNWYENTGYKIENGYIAYNKDEFIDYYGEEEGNMRWASDIYSAPSFTEGDSYCHEPPEGCKFKYNISYLILTLCSVYYNEYDFNIGRTLLRKYVDSLWSLTDPSDENVEQKPIINLRANYNDNIFNLSCWYDFKFTNLRGDKRKNVEKMIQNFKYHTKEESVDMIEWVPSVE